MMYINEMSMMYINKMSMMYINKMSMMYIDCIYKCMIHCTCIYLSTLCRVSLISDRKRQEVINFDKN